MIAKYMIDEIKDLLTYKPRWHNFYNDDCQLAVLLICGLPMILIIDILLLPFEIIYLIAKGISKMIAKKINEGDK